MTVGNELPRSQRRLAIAFLIVVFLCIAAMRWTDQPPIGTDNDEHLIVARTFARTGHFSVADVHATKYPPLISSIAVLFQSLGLNVPVSMVVMNYLAVLASSLALYCFVLRSNGIGMFSLLPAVYLMTNTVLWSSASEIIADALCFLLVTVVLLLALIAEEWTLRTTLLATLLAFLATMARSIGIVAVFPLAASVISSDLRRGRSFPYKRLALLGLLPLASLALFMIYQARFGPHPTGYVETFLLDDPYDASKGSLTLSGFLGRTIRGCVGSVRDLRDLTVFPAWAGLFSFALPLVLFIFALGRDRKRIFVLCSFVLPYLAVVCLWPYKMPRFVLPLLPIAALGVAGAVASGLRSRARVVGPIAVLLVIGHIAVNSANLRREAGEVEQARAFLNSRFGQAAEWCKAHIPESEKIASFDYRELMLRLDRPVVPLRYSSDAKMHIAQLEREGVKWLVLCWHIYPLRGSYAKSIVDALGARARLEYGNDSCEVYRIPPAAPPRRSPGLVLAALPPRTHLTCPGGRFLREG